MTRKVADIYAFDRYQVVYHSDDRYNPYRVIQLWYDCGWHRKQIAKYADIVSAMVYITDLLRRH